MTYLMYSVISGIIYTITINATDQIVDYHANKLGYVRKNKNDHTIPGEILNKIISVLIFSAIAPIANIMTFFQMKYFKKMQKNFSNPKKLISALDNISDYEKLEKLKNELEFKKRIYNKKDIIDAFKIEGANKKIIKIETKKINDEYNKDINLISNRNIERINSMYKARQFLNEIKLNIELTDDEYKKLYNSYIKDFSKKNSKAKAIKKTYKLINKK